MTTAKTKKAVRPSAARTAALAAAGVGIAAAAAAAILLSSPYGKPVRRDLAKRARALRSELARQVARSKRVTKTTYHELVRSVMAQYKTKGRLTQRDFDALVNHLQEGWHNILAQKKTSTPKRKAVRRTSG